VEIDQSMDQAVLRHELKNKRNSFDDLIRIYVFIYLE